jgi:hypothetical protein
VPRPLDTLRLTVALVALQGLGLLGVAAFYVVEMFVATTTDLAAAAVAAGLAALAGTGLLLVARGLARGRRWARSPALLTQLLIAPVAVGLVQGGRWYVGVPLLLWAVGVAVLLFTPAVGAALED